MAEPSVGAPAVVAVSERDVLLATKLHVPRPQPGFVPRPRPVPGSVRLCRLPQQTSEDGGLAEVEVLGGGQ
jgi:hypothetical protein